MLRSWRERLRSLRRQCRRRWVSFWFYFLWILALNNSFGLRLVLMPSVIYIFQFQAIFSSYFLTIIEFTKFHFYLGFRSGNKWFTGSIASLQEGSRVNAGEGKPYWNMWFFYKWRKNELYSLSVTSGHWWSALESGLTFLLLQIICTSKILCNLS